MKRRKNSTLDSPNGFMTTLFGACPGLLSIGWDSPSSLWSVPQNYGRADFGWNSTSKIPSWSANHPLELDWHQFPFRLTMSAIPVLRNNTHSVAVGYLCWILGFFGAHRFYYGKKITGTIWFFTLGLFFIGWLIDLFLIPSMDAEADRKYAPGHLDYTAAWLLLTFLGVFGVHRFYMGKVVTGILWLATGGLCGMGLLFDLLTLNEQVDEMNRISP